MVNKPEVVNRPERFSRMLAYRRTEMATYTVGPMPGDSKRWKVEKDGYRVSKHNSKSNAKQRARKEAGPNDSITVKNRKGEFQKRIRG